MENANIMWYEDDELAIGFNSMPHVCVRYITPSMTETESNSIKKYPFICKTELKVKLFDHEKEEVYSFTIPKGYCWNGSDIPRIFWRIIGSKSEPQYLIASCLHDYMLENKEVIDYDRKLTSKVFKGCLRTAGVSSFKAQIMYLAVDTFQSTVCRKTWK